MAKDPAFLFYPGDYLRDTQCLTEVSQVAYDRIMCEHMRNICITQQQLNFFTKRLTTEEKNDLLMMLSKVKGGYQIQWVAESIEKRRAYSQSRRNNRLKKGERHDEHMLSHDEHMENEIENESKDKSEKGNVKRFTPPTELECQVYFQTKIMIAAEANTEATKFFNFYESKNWMVGKNKMQKWKSAAANWILKINDNGKQIPNSKRTYTASDFTRGDDRVGSQ